MPTSSLPRIIQLQDGSYATPDGKGGWAPYTGTLPDGTTAGSGGAGGSNEYKIGDGDAVSHAWDIIDSISNARQLATKPLSTGTAAAGVTSIPFVGPLVGQNRANLQTKLGAIAGDLRQLGIRTLYQQTGQKGVGSVARNAAEQQALQNSLAPLGFVDQGGHVVANGAQPDEATLNQGLDTAQSIYVRHLARLYGMNPDDPSAIRLVTAAIQDPSLRTSLLQHAQNVSATANGKTPDTVTQSAPPPAIVGSGGHAGISTETQVVTDPNMARIKPQLEQYLAADPSKVSNDQIVAFMKQNGVDPANTNVGAALQYRMSADGAAWRKRGGNYAVSDQVSEPLTGVRKAIAGVSGADPGGVPVGATAVGAADTATLGLIPDAAGVVHAVTGLGPTRQDVITARDLSAQEHPYGTFAGNAIGALLSPLGRAGGIGKTALQSGLYGFFGSDSPDIKDRLLNAGTAVAVGTLAHGGGNLALSSAAPVYRAGRNLILAPIVGNDAIATDNALSRVASKMPTQDLQSMTDAITAARAKGINPPAAAGLSRAGQDFLARLASGSPAAHAVADDAASTYRRALPEALGSDFNQAISDAADASGSNAASFLDRPAREITNDVQNLAGREYETGMQPIANEKLQVTPDLADALTHERINTAIKDALSNHQLSDTTRAALRALPGQLKALAAANIPGANAGVQAGIRAQYAAGIPLTVDATRNIATALDRTAGKLADGSEGAVELRRLSSTLRSAIGEQYPEFQPVNGRYASRMRAIDAVNSARAGFLGESPEQIDALAAASKNFTGFPGEAEYRGIKGAEPSGQVLPSNREFAMAGAREAATVRAGAGSGAGGTNVATQIAEGPNQQIRNKLVLGDSASTVADRAGTRAEIGDVLSRIASGPNEDQAARWFDVAKRALTYKLTGGTAHYATAYALSGLPSMTSADAARVANIYLNASTADQAFNSLSKAYGAKQARTIMARMAGVGTAGYSQHNTPPTVGSPLGAQ